MTTAPFDLPPGNRFATVTPWDHSAWIWLSTLLALTHSFCFLGFRAMVKRNRYALDDAVLTAGYAFALLHWITTFIALHHGIGKTSRLLTEADQDHGSQILFAGRILHFVALCLSKCSVVLLIRHVFTRDLKKAWWACNVALVVMALWGLFAILTASVGCSADSIFEQRPSHVCSNEEVRWQLEAIFDSGSEFGIVALVFSLLLPLQMEWSSKLVVTAAFAFRLPNIVFSVFFVKTYLQHLESADPTLSIAVPLAWQESLLAYGLISATIPCLKSFMNNFQTGGLGFSDTVYGASRTGGTITREDSGESHQLKHMTPSVTSKTHLRRDQGDASWRLSNSIGEDGSFEFPPAR